MIWNNARTYFATFLYSIVTLLVMDLFFFYFTMKTFMMQIQTVQNNSPMILDKTAAALCYVVMAGLLALLVNLGVGPWVSAFIGFSVYAIYELTNKALFHKWFWSTVAIDTVWGAILYGVSYRVVSYLLLSNYNGDKLPFSDAGWK